MLSTCIIVLQSQLLIFFASRKWYSWNGAVWFAFIHYGAQDLVHTCSLKLGRLMTSGNYESLTAAWPAPDHISPLENQDQVLKSERRESPCEQPLRKTFWDYKQECRKSWCACVLGWHNFWSHHLGLEEGLSFRFPPLYHPLLILPLILKGTFFLLDGLTRFLWQIQTLFLCLNGSTWTCH